jgi:hypothetical protein
MRVSDSDKELHDRMLLLQIHTYEKEGSRVVAADLEGWPMPPQVGRHVPDIMVEFHGKVVYNEVETCETISLPETRKKLEEFAEWATLHVTIPQSCLEIAKRIAAERGIEVEEFWHYGGT